MQTEAALSLLSDFILLGAISKRLGLFDFYCLVGAAHLLPLLRACFQLLDVGETLGYEYSDRIPCGGVTRSGGAGVDDGLALAR